MLKQLWLFFGGIATACKKKLKLFWRQAKWKRKNRHNNTRINSLFPLSVVTVGKHTYGRLNIHSYNSAVESLTIGDYCSIADDVQFILSGEHNYKRFSSYPFPAYFAPKQADAFSKGAIVVEDDVWIGYGAVILSGVTLGRGCVVGAGSVVSKNVPPYAVVKGNDVVRYRFSEEIRAKLSKIDLSKINPDKIRNHPLLMEGVTEENVDAVIRAIAESSDVAEIGYREE